MNGKALHSFPKTNPFENIPIDGVRTGPRQIGWMKNEKETLVYVEALDKGDWEVNVPFRDEIFKLEWKDSIKQEIKSLVKLKNRFESKEFLEKELLSVFLALT